MRAELLPLAEKINQALDACGYPLCPGNIMAGNPECCLSVEEWKNRFGHWIDHGTPEHLLKASIFFDFRSLYGDRAPVEELQAWVANRVTTNSRFLRMMAENALRNGPPLGLVHDFVVESGGEHPHSIDLKLRGTTPFVDGARLLAFWPMAFPKPTAWPDCTPSPRKGRSPPRKPRPGSMPWGLSSCCACATISVWSARANLYTITSIRTR